MKVDDVLQLQLQHFTDRAREACAARLSMIICTGPAEIDGEQLDSAISMAISGDPRDRSLNRSKLTAEAIALLMTICQGMLLSETKGMSLMLKRGGELTEIPRDNVEVVTRFMPHR